MPRQQPEKEQLQYCEPLFHTQPSPFYKPTHYKWQKHVRSFVEEHMMPFVDRWDEAGDYPRELHQKAYDAGIYGAMWPAEFGGTPPEDCDSFHDLIMIDELARTGCGGVLWACFYSHGIALPPVLNVGSQYLKDLVARDVISGRKIMSLAVTEPNAGSDVAQLETTAVLDGDEWVINGEKYFITSGMKADFYTVAVRTGGPGMKGVSLMLVERSRPGIFTSRMKTQGWWTSTTTYVVFRNVRVPKKNLIGELNSGFKPIMHNFNHERFLFATMATRFARVCLEEAMRYSKSRKTFGKRLADHQVLRHKMMEMSRAVESTQAMLEQVCYMMKSGVSDKEIGGPMALVKVQATKTMEFCAREAVQVFGGRGYIRGGRAAKVERLYREVRVMAIAGGSEEIMIDLAARQAKL